MTRESEGWESEGPVQPLREPTLGDALSVWWLVTWRTWAGTILLIMLTGLLFGGSRYAEALMVLYFGVTLLWQVFVIQQAMRKQYANFRLVIAAPRDEFVARADPY